MALKKVQTAFGPLMVDTVTGALLVVAAPLQPIGPPVPLVELTAGAAYSHATTFAAGTYAFAWIRLKAADAFVHFTDSASDPAQDGHSLPVNGLYKIEIDATATHLHIKRDDAGTDAKVKVTLVPPKA